MSGVERLQAKGDNSTLFRRLVQEHGGAVAATKMLLRSGRHTSYGCERLWELEEQDEAQQRLVLHDFPLGQRLDSARHDPPSWWTGR